MAALLYRGAEVNCRFEKITGNRGVMSNLKYTLFANVAWTLSHDGARGYVEATILARAAFDVGVISDNSE
jgi:hypothetical protein